MLYCLTSFGQELVLDPKKTKIEWVGYGEVGDFVQKGEINAKAGSLILTDGNIDFAEIIIDMKSINHPDKSLSKHLKNKDFFWSDKYPSANLELLDISKDTIVALLTIKEITNEIRFPYKFENENSTVIKGYMTIDRTKYNIKYNSSSFFQDLGNYAIKNEFDLKFEAVFKE